MSHRIVSLLPAGSEIVRALGAEEQLVGGPELARAMVDSDRLSMREIQDEVGRILSAGEPLYQIDEEGITALEPTVILSQGLCPVCAATPEMIEGVRVPELVVLSPHSLEDVASNILEVAHAIGKKEQAFEVVREFQIGIASVKQAAVRRPKRKLAVLEWFDPLWISGEWAIDMVEAVGCTAAPVADDRKSKQITFDELAAADPDGIILAPCSMSIPRAERELPVLHRNGSWNALRAVQEGRIKLLDGEAHFSCPGPRLAEGLQQLSQAVDEMFGADDAG